MWASQTQAGSLTRLVTVKVSKKRDSLPDVVGADFGAAQLLGGFAMARCPDTAESPATSDWPSWVTAGMKTGVAVVRPFTVLVRPPSVALSSGRIVWPTSSSVGT